MKKNLHKFKVGDRVKIIGNSAGHNIAIGTKVKIRQVSGAGVNTVYSFEGFTYNAYERDIEAVSFSRKDIEAEIDEMEAEINSMNLKLKFMQDMNLDEYDEDEFRIYGILSAVEGKGTKMEKARLIKKLLDE
jgi:hypothetical protein